MTKDFCCAGGNLEYLLHTQITTALGVAPETRARCTAYGPSNILVQNTPTAGDLMAFSLIELPFNP